MERKDYLVEELSKEEKLYLKRIVMTAKNKCFEKNYNTLTIHLCLLMRLFLQGKNLY